MKSLFLVTIGFLLLYLLVRGVRAAIRRAQMSRLLEKIDKLHAALIKGSRDELASLHENYEKWKSGDKVQRVVNDEEDLLGRIVDAKADLEHQEAVQDKYFRLRARFATKSQKSEESIVAYHDYLSIKMRQHLDSESFVRALNVGAMTFEEFAESARRTKVLVEESERKLDLLLS